MDIGSNSSYPANALSNFSGHRFEIEGIVKLSTKEELCDPKMKYSDYNRKLL